MIFSKSPINFFISILASFASLRTLLCLIVLSSCTSPSQNNTSSCESLSTTVDNSLNKTNDLEKFFRYFLFLEGGVYTLLGSKPVTTFSIYYEEESTHNQFNHPMNCQNCSFVINKENKEDLDFYYSLNDAQKKHAILVDDCDYIFDATSLWNEWEKVAENLNISKKYLFFKREFSEQEKKSLPPSCKKAYDVIFINILEAACVLEKYYEQFKKALGCDFNPLEELLKIPHTKTPFWDCFFGENSSQHPHLLGLLYGYGWENSLIFKWKLQSESGAFNQDAHDFLDQIEPNFTGGSLLHGDILKDPNPFSWTNFPLPTFASFQINDLNIKKYSQEREKIIEYYNGRGFVQATLDILTSSQPTKRIRPDSS